MKQIFTPFLLVFVVLSLSNCKKIDEFTQFDMNYNQTVVIPSSSGINLPFNLFAPDVETNSESEFAINDTRKDLIEEITLKTLGLEITSPSNGDFSFLKSIAIYINAEGLGELEIAKDDDVQGDNTKTLTLTPTALDLKEYIKKDQFTLRFKTVTDEVLTQDYHIRANTQFFVDAKILGQ